MKEKGKLSSLVLKKMMMMSEESYVTVGKDAPHKLVNASELTYFWKYYNVCTNNLSFR